MEQKIKHQWSFWNGWHEVPQSRHNEIKSEIMSALKITSNVAFCQRRRGLREPKFSEFTEITEIFRRYGVAVSKIWGGSAKSK